MQFMRPPSNRASVKAFGPVCLVAQEAMRVDQTRTGTPSRYGPTSASNLGLSQKEIRQRLLINALLCGGRLVGLLAVTLSFAQDWEVAKFQPNPSLHFEKGDLHYDW